VLLRVVLRCRLEAEASDDTERDLMGLVEELVADDGAGEEVWDSLRQKEREKLLSIFKRHNLNLTTAVRSVSACWIVASWYSSIWLSGRSHVGDYHLQHMCVTSAIFVAAVLRCSPTIDAPILRLHP
jgi:hypothetical protein